MTDWNANLLPRLTAIGLDKRLPVLAMLVMTAILAYGLALVTWELLPRQSQDALSMPAVSSMPSSPAGKRQQTNIARISQWHLFGKVQKVAPKPVATVTDAPDTRLNLKLSGVLASSDPMGARAIIADGKGSLSIYKKINTFLYIELLLRYSFRSIYINDNEPGHITSGIRTGNPQLPIY